MDTTPMIKVKDDITDFFSHDTLGEFLASKLRPMKPVPTDMMPGGDLRTPLKCILFDVYGTLLISGTGDISIARKSVHASEQLQTLLDNFRISTAPKVLLKKFFNEIRETHRRARQEGTDWPEVRIERIWSRVLDISHMNRAMHFAIEFEVMANPVWPMPHLEELLAACRKEALPMGIISNAQFYTPLILRWFLKEDLPGLGFEKDLLIYSFEAGVAKPSTRLFRLAAGQLKKMGILPETVLYVGNDLQKDILPAKQSGFQTTLFAGDARSLRPGYNDPAYKNLQADLVVTDLGQLLPYIN